VQRDREDTVSDKTMTREKLVGWANRYAGVACEVGEAMEVAEAVLSLVQGEARLQVERDDAMAVSSERSKQHTAAVARAEAAEAEVSLAVGALTGMQARVEAAEAKLAEAERRAVLAETAQATLGELSALYERKWAANESALAASREQVRRVQGLLVEAREALVRPDCHHPLACASQACREGGHEHEDYGEDGWSCGEDCECAPACRGFEPETCPKTTAVRLLVGRIEEERAALDALAREGRSRR
jgi:hypothetical protein